MPEIVTVHGFRVYPYGRMTTGFRRALQMLSAKGFGDPSCVVVVPGAMTLYHEWGHYVDRRWSQPDQEIRFSFRWFSAFYAFYRIRPRVLQPWPCHLVHLAKPATAAPTPELDAADAALTWYRVSSELFANLFEDWMRGKVRVSWDHCHPDWLDEHNLGGSAITASVDLDLLADVTVEEVRARTYDLFARGLRAPAVLPPVRDGFLGPSTATTLGRLRRALRTLAAESSRSSLEEAQDHGEQAE